LAEFRGEPATETYKVELVCIIDSQTSGMLVARNEKRNLVLPNLAVFHWLKRFFEWWYLRQYR
jgi:sulfide:quinone oxidoreductase